MANGFAAIDYRQDGKILVDTVSTSERAAMTKWLMLFADMMIPDGMGDFALREHFDQRSTIDAVKIEKVDITYAE